MRQSDHDIASNDLRSVQTNELFPLKPPLETAERSMQEVTSGASVQAHIVSLRANPIDAGKGEANQFSAVWNPQVASEDWTSRPRCRLQALRGSRGGDLQSIRTHRFQQVIDRGQLESSDREIVECRGENDRWRLLSLHLPRYRQAIEASHANVQKQYVRRQSRDQRQRLRATGSGPDDLK
jgi:hypothetical protein